MQKLNVKTQTGFNEVDYTDGIVGFEVNAVWTVKMVGEMTERLKAIEPTCKGVIFYAGGNDFCMSSEVSVTEASAAIYQALGTTLLNYSKPTLALLYGQALGIGYEIAMCCDSIKPIENHVNYGFDVVNQLGVVAGGFSKSVFEIYKLGQTPASLDLVPQFKKLLNAACFGKPMPCEPIDEAQLAFALEEACGFVGSMTPQSIDSSEVSCMGSTGISALEIVLLNMAEGRFISEEAFIKARKLATVISGGDVPRGTMMTMDKFVALEKQAFTQI